MKKIVIFDTALGTSNNGDEIILNSVNEAFEELISSNFSLRLATHVNNFTLMQLLRNNNKIKFFKNADYKFICGTNLISQKRIGKVNAQWQLNTVNMPIYKDCILVGAGTTSDSNKLDILAKVKYKSVLSKEYYHSVRDNQTKEILESIGIKSINTGCPTLWKLTPEFCETIPKEKSDNCIFTLSGYENQQDITNDQIMVDILKKNYKKLWCYIQTTDDEIYMKSLNGTDEIERIYSLNSYKKIINIYHPDYVGTRLHGGIFALQNGCRSLIVSIDHRARGVYETNNIPIIERINISTELENMINKNIDTKIVINEKNILDFKNQF